MESGGETKRTSPFWPILPFIITSCFIVPMVVSGPNPGEEDSFWYILLPGVALFVFPAAKTATLIIQANIKARTFHITREMYDSNPDIRDMKDKVKKWWCITLLTGISVFLLMMGGVRILNAIKRQDKPRPSASNQWASNRNTNVRDYSEGSAETGVKNIPPAFIESSSVHKRLQFYDNLIYRLTPLPFLGMLAGAIYLIRSLIGRWWKKGRKTPLIWKIVPFVAVACFLLPLMLTDAIVERMNTTIRTEALKFLSDVSDSATVIINGKAVDNPEQVIAELSTVGLATSHPCKPPQVKSIRIQVVDRDYSLTLELGRDSWFYTEYWIFYPGYHYTSLNNMGHIKTELFNTY